ncbi:hypothetical protein V6N13_123636 [Hibiscus sabdariffa]|uniref:ZF-HD dimerization-type domain-containing protein n=1 Tax=Hibiscus sabdariffa TaxID=183260 RepID=A0ABR2QU43_9ROSI
MEVAPTTPKSPDPETETPNWIQPTTKSKPFTNGVLKRHHHNHQAPPLVVTYKECLKNHAATLGGHALDGCGEFMASPTPLKCAACGCHRNFHRREPEDPPLTTTATTEYQPHHRHHPPQSPPSTQHRSPNSASPPPISSSYHPSAPHMLLSLSGGLAGALDNHRLNLGSNPKKRFRTKFSQFQKDKMLEFAERIGWKIQRRDEESIKEFCNEVGIDKGVLKVWMHNNKNNFDKKDEAINGAESGKNNNIDGGIRHEDDDKYNNNNNNNGQNLNHHFETVHLGTNGSSSS